MIIRWDPKYWPNHKFEYQRLGFRAPSSMLQAVEAAQACVEQLSAVARPHSEKRKMPVEVCAVYRREAFRDWSKEVGYNYKNKNDFIKQTLDIIKKDKEKAAKGKPSKPIKPMTQVEFKKITMVR